MLLMFKMTKKEIIKTLAQYVEFFDIEEDENENGDLYITDVQLKEASKILKSIKKLEQNNKFLENKFLDLIKGAQKELKNGEKLSTERFIIIDKGILRDCVITSKKVDILGGVTMNCFFNSPN